MHSQSVADNILSMITIEKRFAAGDKLPNELDLLDELNVGRTTLREAIRILTAYDILEAESDGAVSWLPVYHFHTFAVYAGATPRKDL